MRKLVDKINEINSNYARDFGEEYENNLVSSEEKLFVPDSILALDRKTKIKCSKQMFELFEIIKTWKDAFYGKTIVTPNDVSILLDQREILSAIESVTKFSAPYPPSVIGDYQRTTIYAYDPEELRFAFFWWEHPDDDEPCIIDYDEGHIGVFASIKDHLISLADEETVTEAGLRIEARIQRRRVA